MYLSSHIGAGGVEARVVEASIASGTELWTIETKAPKFIDAEFEKHRMLSSNSSSSRAIPFAKTVENADFFPFDIRAKQAGMQGDYNVSEEVREEFLEHMALLREEVVATTDMYKDTVHKQHINRYLEPWAWQKKVVTATEWGNFFKLRLAAGAQPEIQELARCMKKVMNDVRDNGRLRVLGVGDWHLPYVEFDPDQDSLTQAKMCSAARCARVSYMNHDRESPKLQEDLKLSKMLLSSGHLTPFEHQATPMRPIMNEYTWDRGVTHQDRDGYYWSANFGRWIQHRQLVQ